MQSSDRDVDKQTAAIVSSIASQKSEIASLRSELARLEAAAKNISPQQTLAPANADNLSALEAKIAAQDSQIACIKDDVMRLEAVTKTQHNVGVISMFRVISSC